MNRVPILRDRFFVKILFPLFNHLNTDRPPAGELPCRCDNANFLGSITSFIL
jgi:hypothetical protein